MNMVLRIKNSPGRRVPQVLGQAVESFRTVEVVPDHPIVGGAEKSPDLTGFVIVVDCQALGLACRTTTGDSATTALGLVQAVVVAGFEPVRPRYSGIMTPLLDSSLEHPVVRGAARSGPAGIPLGLDPLDHAVFANPDLQDRSPDMKVAPDIAGAFC